MASQVEIANWALSMLDRGSIAAFDEPTAEALAVRTHWDGCRRLLLTTSLWRFAEDRVVLARVPDVWSERYPYSYAKPSNMLRLRRIVHPRYDLRGELTPIPFETTRRTINTTVPTAIAAYTFDVVDTTEFPPVFAKALGHLLAREIAMPLTRDAKNVQLAQDLYSAHLSLAISNDAGESTNSQDLSTEWLEARY